MYQSWTIGRLNAAWINLHPQLLATSGPVWSETAGWADSAWSHQWIPALVGSPQTFLERWGRWRKHNPPLRCKVRLDVQHPGLGQSRCTNTQVLHSLHWKMLKAVGECKKSCSSSCSSSSYSSLQKGSCSCILKLWALNVHEVRLERVVALARCLSCPLWRGLCIVDQSIGTGDWGWSHRMSQIELILSRLSQLFCLVLSSTGLYAKGMVTFLGPTNVNFEMVTRRKRAWPSWGSCQLLVTCWIPYCMSICTTRQRSGACQLNSLNVAASMPSQLAILNLGWRAEGVFFARFKKKGLAWHSLEFFI